MLFSNITLLLALLHSSTAIVFDADKCRPARATTASHAAEAALKLQQLAGEAAISLPTSLYNKCLIDTKPHSTRLIPLLEFI